MPPPTCMRPMCSLTRARCVALIVAFICICICICACVRMYMCVALTVVRRLHTVTLCAVQVLSPRQAEAAGVRRRDLLWRDFSRLCWRVASPLRRGEPATQVLPLDELPGAETPRLAATPPAAAPTSSAPAAAPVAATVAAATATTTAAAPTTPVTSPSRSAADADSTASWTWMPPMHPLPEGTGYSWTWMPPMHPPEPDDASAPQAAPQRPLEALYPVPCTLRQRPLEAPLWSTILGVSQAAAFVP